MNPLRLGCTLECFQVSSVVERPDSMEAKHWTQQALMTQTAAPPSVQMNSDVRAIAAKQRALLAEKAKVVGSYHSEIQKCLNSEIASKEALKVP